ncbi:MAG: T9SS type A sorting domain-containing protein [Candidatus Cloacimonetes bacterium]|nr:T9SS type A sorting domain-containing protein [Candidatus Cloacimonadota bacterium]
MPAVTTLFQNYPNPVKNGTTIKFALTKPGFVSLKVYNVKGEKVTTFLQNNLEEAIHTVNWNIADSKKKLPNGIYFYELQTPQKIITKKMIIMK